LAEHTTLRVGGPAGRFATARSEAALISAVRAADAAGQPVLILGGGSNLLVADEGFPGLVLRVATRGRRAAAGEAGQVLVQAAAGESWDRLAAWTVERGWAGLEALSGIPGTVGAAPVQNIGAYGAEAADVVVAVRVFDRREARVRRLAAAECGFGYRTSRFKAEPDRHLVLSVDCRLRADAGSAPLAYGELAARLGGRLGDRAEAAAVRAAVLDLRRSKGMVLDPADRDTWGAGSFFTNPVLTVEAAAALPPAAPRYRQPDGSVKTSAAWLIEQAGFAKGAGAGPARLSGKHALALVNRGGATAVDLLALAARVRDGVRAAFGVRLEPELVLIGCRLPEPAPA
jgi:UDP-N-acetylmuramate dehydrogenase